MSLNYSKSNSRKAQIFLGLLVFGFSVPAFAQYDLPPQGGTIAADTEVRMQGLESTIRDLTGKIEQQDYQIRQLKDQLDKLKTDTDMRLNDLQGGTGSGSNGGGGFTNNPIHSGSSDVSGGMQYQGKIQDNSVSPDAGADNNSGYKWNSGNGSSSNTKPGQLGSFKQNSSGETTGGGDASSDLYENAYSLLKSAQYDEAEKEFKSFLKQYPNSAMVPNAKYWLGETYYVRGQFEKAAQTFAEGYQAAPKGAKAADNLLKMGMSLSGMGKKQDACTALGQIGKQFPSAGPVMNRAKQEMTRLGC